MHLTTELNVPIGVCKIINRMKGRQLRTGFQGIIKSWIDVLHRTTGQEFCVIFFPQKKKEKCECSGWR